MPPVPLNIPRVITSGDTVTWRDSFNDFYKPPEYSLSWAIRGSSSLNLISTWDGDSFVTTISSNTSATLSPDTYFFQAYATSIHGSRTTIGSGQITVIANLELQSGNYDGSTKLEKMLAAVEAAISAHLVGGAVQSYEIKGRRLDRTPLPDLIALRSQLRIEVTREQSARGLIPDSRRLHIRFWSPR